jgi:AmmeMemoRadiSam system protein A
MDFTKEEKSFLLSSVNAVIRDYLKHGSYDIQHPPPSLNNLHQYAGAFVSAYVDGKLRGCLGTFSEDDLLFKNVQKMAIAAVSRDSRFDRISLNELNALDIEISILTPRRRIEDISEIEIGTHGIYIEKEYSRGTFLPQVAVDQDWTVEEFLRYCAKYKAGLDWEGWRNADIYVYEAVILK